MIKRRCWSNSNAFQQQNPRPGVHQTVASVGSGTPEVLVIEECRDSTMNQLTFQDTLCVTHQRE